MTKSLIVGITGMVGSHLADFLLTQGEEVYGTIRDRSKTDNIEHIMDKVHLVNCELLDSHSVMNCVEKVKPDVIYHLAAQSFVQASFDEPAVTVSTNVIGTINLLEAIKKLRLNPVIHVCSSSEVYGQVKKSETPITEHNTFRPASPYAVSKVGEDMIAYQYFRSYGLKAIVTRAFTHTGPRRTKVFAESAFARQIALIEKGKQKPVIKVGNLDSVRTWLDVRDIVRAYWLLTKHCKAGEVYVIGGTTTMTIGAMLNHLISISTMKNKIKVEVDKALLRPSDVTYQIPSCKKFVSATRWKPEIPFETTMQDLLDYWRDRV